ncbi:glycoside hydrolase domain-containing protein [Cohnella yongneupensis]|uniref:Glycoside hydrolase domain-containing protein n=1 Tax=Cohnella yongneupensis TaxID=425006 RepID=A0ABW0QWG1_9BACL
MIKHTRVRIVNGKMEEAPLQYSGAYSKAQGWTDIRVADIPLAAVMSTELVIAKGKTVPQILADLVSRKGGNWLVFNASFFNQQTGTIVGKAYQNGKIIAQDVAGKTEHRPHLYHKGGRFGVGRLATPTGVDWAVVDVPTLTAGGKALALRPEEKTPSDVQAINPRMIAGIKPDGTFGVIAVDGRGNVDRGLNSKESGILAMNLGYGESVNLDGGSSATIATNNRQLLDALEIDKDHKKRTYHVADMSRNHSAAPVHHAVAIQFDPAKLFPKPVTLFGVDCAQPLNATKAKAVAGQGAKFVARYLVPEEYKWKRLTLSEAQAIAAAGMQIVSAFETKANRPEGGALAGTEDGSKAYKEAIAIGQPVGTAIYFAVDYDTGPKDYDTIEAYLRAAAMAIPGYEVGAYGEYEIIEEMAKRGAAKHFWQTYAWSAGKKSAHADIWQYKNNTVLAGHPVDFNESYRTDVGWKI